MTGTETARGGPLTRPEALLLVRPDAEGVLLPIGLSLPLPPMFRDEAARYVTPTGEPRRRLPTTVLGQRAASTCPCTRRSSSRRRPRRR